MKKIKKDKFYALIIIKDLIENHRFETLIDYVLLSWKSYPQLKQREILNAITIEYINKNNKREKNEKNNIVKFHSHKLN
jgi:ABC-type microcin C transport system permease subunit YejE